MANENITGTFDRRATYEDFTTKNNLYGEPERTYATYKELWVNVSYSGGGEAGENKQEVAEKIQNRILIPEEFLTAIKNRGQDGKPVLRGQKPATGK
jgi:hypothetical protein